MESVRYEPVIFYSAGSRLASKHLATLFVTMANALAYYGTELITTV
jgi:hypothetical protein